MIVKILISKNADQILLKKKIKLIGFEYKIKTLSIQFVIHKDRIGSL
jgi:hypothetical protein